MLRFLLFLALGLSFSERLHGQNKPHSTRAPRLWTDDALAGWALPIAGVNTVPTFYSEAEYYAAPVDELKTYPAYVNGREPKGYRAWLKKQKPKPLIEIGKARTDAQWIKAGLEVFVGMDLPANRTDDPRAIAWMDDPAAPAGSRASVTGKGEVLGVRWVIDHDGKLKLTLNECAACHTRLLRDGTVILGAQGNMNLANPLFGVIFENAGKYKARFGPRPGPGESSYRSFGVPWLPDDVHARFKSIPTKELRQITGVLPTVSTFPRFNGSPYFTNRMPDLIGLKDRKYLDATGSHRNRGPEDVARYGILVTGADDGAIGPHTFFSEADRKIHFRRSDDAMYALGKYIDALEPPPNPNSASAISERGRQVFSKSGCGGCHTPPLYTNNKLVPANGFARLEHSQSPPASDVMTVDMKLDPGLALKTRKGTGYYKVPSLKGLWYRDTLEHSGSIGSLEEWFDEARLRDDYVSKGWNPPGTKHRPIPGHPFGLQLSTEDKQSLIAFLRTL